jgi:DNA-binding NarL/FixJ family response regulator
MGNLGKILIADNDGEFLGQTAAQLRQEGYKCVCALDVPTAVDLLRGSYYDLLISDIQLVESLLLDLLEDPAHAGDRLPTLLLTISPGISRGAYSPCLPVAASLIKPIVFDALLMEIQRILKDPPLPLLSVQGFPIQNHREKMETATPSASNVLGSEAFIPNLLKNLSAAIEIIKESTEMLVSSRGPSSLVETVPSPEKYNDDNIDKFKFKTWSPGLQEALKQLSPREQEIVHHLYERRRVSTIAQMLYLSPHTVRNHLKSIYRKLRVKSQVDLVAQLLQKSVQVGAIFLNIIGFLDFFS